MEFFEFVWVYILVFLLAAVPFVEAIILAPIAIFGGLSPLPVFLLAVSGNLLTVFFVIIFIERIKQWRKKKDNEKRKARAQRIWQKYGVIGLTIIGPYFIGSHLSAFLSLLFGGTKKQVTIWITISVVGWTLVFTIIAVLGFDFMKIEHPFLEQIFGTQ